MGEPARKLEDNIVHLFDEVEEEQKENMPPADRYAQGREELAKKKKVLPFRSTDEVNQVVSYLLSKGKYRDACLFVMGCNFGLRIDDLLHIRWRDLLLGDGTIRPTVELVEKKNKNQKRIFVNEAVCEAVKLYIEHLPHELDLDGYVFVSEGRRKRSRAIATKDGNIEVEELPLTEQLVSGMIRAATADIGLTFGGRRFSTHSMRKTCFRAAYGAVEGVKLPPVTEVSAMRLSYVRKLAGHSKDSITMDYIDFEDLFDEGTYLALNLGLEAIRKYIKTHDETVVC